MSDSLQPRELYSPWNSPGQNTRVSSLSLLQGISPTQGSNPGLPHCTRTQPSELSGKPKNTGVGSLSLFQGIFPTQESNQGLLHCRQILYQLSYQGSPNPVNLKINITADKNHNSFGRSIRNTINPDENTLNNIISTVFLIKYICVSIIIQN